MSKKIIFFGHTKSVFFKHKNCHLTLCSCNLITDYYPFFCKPTCVSLPLHGPLHSWVTILLFSSSCSGMPFIPVVCSQSSFVAHFGMSLAHLRSCTGFFLSLLHIFGMSVEHFPNFLRIFLYIEMISFFLHCAPKPQAVVVTISHFISRRRVSYFMLFICLITLNSF